MALLQLQIPLLRSYILIDKVLELLHRLRLTALAAHQHFAAVVDTDDAIRSVHQERTANQGTGIVYRVDIIQKRRRLLNMRPTSPKASSDDKIPSRLRLEVH